MKTNDAVMKAIQKVLAVLETLDSDRQRRRVMKFVQDHFDEIDQRDAEDVPTTGQPVQAVLQGGARDLDDA